MGIDKYGRCKRSSMGAVSQEIPGGGCLRDMTWHHNSQTICTRYGGGEASRQMKRRCVPDIYAAANVNLSTPDRISYLFLTTNDTSQIHELKSGLLSGRPAYDVLLISCPVLSRLLPGAYNYSLSREKRHTAINLSSSTSRATALRGLGAACLPYAWK